MWGGGGCSVGVWSVGGVVWGCGVWGCSVGVWSGGCGGRRNVECGDIALWW